MNGFRNDSFTEHSYSFTNPTPKPYPDRSFFPISPINSQKLGLIRFNWNLYIQIPTKTITFSHAKSSSMFPLYSKFSPFLFPLFTLLLLPLFYFPSFRGDPFGPSTGPMGSPRFLPFFPHSHPSEDPDAFAELQLDLCLLFPFFLYFQGFLAVSLLFFFVFFLFEKEENKRESCLRRYETV